MATRIVKVTFDTSEAKKAADDLGKSLKTALGGGSQAVKPLKDTEKAALQAAQGLARLAIAKRDLVSAEKILVNALSGVNRETATAIRVQTQLATIQNRLASEADKAAAAQRKLAQEIARTSDRGGGGLSANISDITAALRGLKALVAVALLKEIGDAILSIGKVSFNAAIQIDKSRQTLVALTGSVTAANQKLAQLRDLATKTPGLTASVATSAFAQLKAAANLADNTINQVLKGVGRLNAVFSIDDTGGFIRNLTQIFSQGFERADIKEALGRVPIFEQLLESAFGTKDPDKLRKLKAAGELTIDTFFAGVAGAINNNPTLAAIQESIGGQFEKLQERIISSLAPIGDEIARGLLPLLQRLAPVVESAVAIIVPHLRDIGDLISQNKIQIDRVIEATKKLADDSGPILSVFASAWKDFVEFQILSSIASIDYFVRSVNVAVNAAKTSLATIGSFASTAFSIVTGVNFNPSIAGNFVSGKLGPQRVRGLDGEVVTQGDIADAFERQRLAGVKPPTGKQTGAGGTKKSLTELQELQRTLKSLNKDLSDFADLTRPEFRLKLEIEEKETFKRDLERIINLTRELGLELGVNFRIATISASSAAGELERLNEIKKTREAFNRFRTDNEFQNIGGGLSAAAGEVTRAAGLRGIEEAFAGAQAGDNRRTASILEREKALREESLRLQTQQLAIENQVIQGVLTEAQAKSQLLAIERQLAAVRTNELLDQRGRLTDPEKIGEIDREIERLKTVGLELSPIESLFKGLRSEADTLADKMLALGQNLKAGFVDAFTTLLTTGKFTFGNLFNIVKTTIARMTAELIASKIFQFFAGGFGLGGGSSSGGGFITPPFNPAASGGGSVFGSVLGGLFGGGGGTGFGGFGTPPFNPSAGSAGQIAAAQSAISGDIFGSGRSTGFGNVLGSSGISKAISKGPIGKLLSGLTGGGAVSLLPAFLGASLGAGLGGQSVLGQILGGIGGSAVGLGVGFGAAVLGAGGTLGAAALAALGPAALIGAPLLIGAILLGKAKQRKKDEEASGDFLTEAIAGIRELRASVSTDAINGAQARTIFENQILGNFIQQINTLKTKSVRESRLKNQVADLRKLFEDDVGPEIALQKQRRRVQQNLIPEFATGGIVPGIGSRGVLVKAHPGEVILNQFQQSRVESLSGQANIFKLAGVPGADGRNSFASGGTVDQGAGFDLNGAVVEVHISEDTVDRIFVRGANREPGQRALESGFKKGRLNREI